MYRIDDGFYEGQYLVDTLDEEHHCIVDCHDRPDDRSHRIKHENELFDSRSDDSLNDPVQDGLGNHLFEVAKELFDLLPKCRWIALDKR